jgi:hypothetical protein
MASASPPPGAAGRKTTARRALAVAVAVGLAVPACSFVTNLSGLDSETGQTTATGAGGAATTSSGKTTSASTAAGGGDAGPDVDTCMHAVPPPAPATSMPGDVGPIVVALRTVDLGEVDDAIIGFDLDGLCTCEGTPMGPPDCLGSVLACDHPHGVDDAAQALFSLILSALGSVSSVSFSAAANDGQWSSLAQITGYNGLADDDQVTLDSYGSVGFVGLGADGGPPVPAWDGSDVWYISSESVKNGNPNTPLFQDTHAYVANHMLVTHLANVVFRFPTGSSNLLFQLSNVVMAGTLAQDADAGGWSLTGGTLAGMWTYSDVFALISSYRDAGGSPICTGSTEFLFGKSQICAAGDILTSGPPDTSTMCDAISFGMSFSSYAAQLGPVLAPAPTTPGCPAGTDPADSTCE